MDNWATFTAPARIAVLVQQLRGQLDDTLQKLQKAQGGVTGREQSTLNVVRSLLASDGY